MARFAVPEKGVSEAKEVGCEGVCGPPLSPLEVELPPIFQHPKLTVRPTLKLYLGGAFLQDP